MLQIEILEREPGENIKGFRERINSLIVKIEENGCYEVFDIIELEKATDMQGTFERFIIKMKSKE